MTEWHPLRSLPTETTSADEVTWQKWNSIAEERAKQESPASLPSLDHLGMKEYNEIYEPSDDTFLLLDALQYEYRCGNILMTPSSHGQTASTCILEIGCGSGVASVYLALESQKFNWREHEKQSQQQEEIPQTKAPSVVLYVTDINPKAVRIAQRTALANGIPIIGCSSSNSIGSGNSTSGNNNTNIKLEALQCDLLSPMLPRMNGMVDILLFNPPYVPTPDDEVVGSTTVDGQQQDCLLQASWAGGERGRRVIDRAIPQICSILSRPHGIAYLVTVDDNEPLELAQTFRRAGLDMKPLLRRRAYNEFLTIQKITRIP